MPHPERPARRSLIAQALKAVRRRRGFKASEVAARLAMPLRTYEEFEAGRGRIDLPRLEAFAQALDADLYALLFAVELGSPAFALRCLDNKLATALVMMVEEFDTRAGDLILSLDPQTAMHVLRRAFAELTATARERQAFVETWMTARALSASDPEADADDADPAGAAARAAEPGR